MSISIPVILNSLSTAGSAAKEFVTWRKKAKGDSRSVVTELKDNLLYLDMVYADGVSLEAVIEKLSVSEYQRLSKEGFSFNSLKRASIKHYHSLDGTDLASYVGKDTEHLVGSIYSKLNELKIRYPIQKHNTKYRWTARVNNIRKRILLLLIHVKDH